MSQQRKPTKAQIKQEAEGFFYQGDKYLGERNWEQAAEHYLKACELLPDHNFSTYLPFNTWHRVGLVLVQLQKQTEALPYLYRALFDYQVKQNSQYPDAYYFSSACIYALVKDKYNMLKMLAISFEHKDKYVCEVYEKIEFEPYMRDEEFQNFMNTAVERTKQRRTSFDVTELQVMGCDNCRTQADPTDGHDWTIICSQCGNSFSYSGCSCDGCCGGTYAGYGGGRTVYHI